MSPDSVMFLHAIRDTCDLVGHKSLGGYIQQFFNIQYATIINIRDKINKDSSKIIHIKIGTCVPIKTKGILFLTETMLKLGHTQGHLSFAFYVSLEFIPIWKKYCSSWNTFLCSHYANCQQSFYKTVKNIAYRSIFLAPRPRRQRRGSRNDTLVKRQFSILT